MPRGFGSKLPSLYLNGRPSSVFTLIVVLPDGNSNLTISNCVNGRKGCKVFIRSCTCTTPITTELPALDPTALLSTPRLVRWPEGLCLQVWCVWMRRGGCKYYITLVPFHHELVLDDAVIACQGFPVRRVEQLLELGFRNASICVVKAQSRERWSFFLRWKIVCRLLWCMG